MCVSLVIAGHAARYLKEMCLCPHALSLHVKRLGLPGMTVVLGILWWHSLLLDAVQRHHNLVSMQMQPASDGGALQGAFVVFCVENTRWDTDELRCIM